MIRIRRLAALVVGLLAAALLVPAHAVAAPVVSVRPMVGPPTTAVTLTASGFGASEAVDVYADTTAIRLAVASASGAVSVPTTVPASAQPGQYWFTMIGRRTGTAAQVAFTVRTDSPQPGFAATGAGYNRYENTITASTAPTLQPRWSASFSVGERFVTSGGRLFAVGSDENEDAHVAAFDARTGVLRWNVAAASTFYEYPPAVVGGTVVVVREDGVLVGLNPVNGATTWTLAATTAESGPVGPVVGTGTTVLVGYTNHTVRAVNAATGAVVWTASVDGSLEGLAASPATGTVVVSSSPNLAALDLATGATRWTTPIGDDLTVPVISGNVIAVGTADGFDSGKLLCTFDLGTGARAWCAGLSSRVASIAMARNHVLATSEDRASISSYSLPRGTLQWTAPIVGYFPQVSIAGGLVWTGDAGSGGLYTALSLETGKPVASVGSAVTEYQAPLVANGVLYTASGIGPTARITAFTVPSGRTDSARPAVATLRQRGSPGEA